MTPHFFYVCFNSSGVGGDIFLMDNYREYESPKMDIVELFIEGACCTMSSTEGLNENNGSWDFDW